MANGSKMEWTEATWNPLTHAKRIDQQQHGHVAQARHQQRVRDSRHGCQRVTRDDWSERRRSGHSSHLMPATFELRAVAGLQAVVSGTR
jgi:hypothetical protein